MKKIAIAFIITVFCVLTCAFVAGVVSAQGGWEKTLTLQSGEKVLDMRGEWDVLIEPSKRFEFWFQDKGSNILQIKQKGTKFSAIQLIENRMAPEGTERIKGVLDKDGFKEVQFYGPRGGKLTWVPVTWEISEHGNKIVIVYEDTVTWTLTRR